MERPSDIGAMAGGEGALARRGSTLCLAAGLVVAAAAVAGLFWLAPWTLLTVDRCAEPGDADCIRAVYRGAPSDYAQVVEIPEEALLTPDAHGRYQVARGEQVTVVTAAPLPQGWTRFYLARTPLGSPSPLSYERLIPPLGTTYTFTATEDEGGSNLITFDLTAARPFVRPRPDGKPELGEVVARTTFLVPTLRYDTLDATGAATEAGSYAFVTATDGSAELRVHPTDASGTSRAAFYDTVRAGETFDYRTNGLDCTVRYRVTEVGAASTPRTFGIEYVARYLGHCEPFGSDPGAARDVEFVWSPPPGLPGADGVVAMFHGEPVGPGTYRPEPGVPYTIDVPSGMSVHRIGSYIAFTDSGPVHGLGIVDAGTGAVLHLDAGTGAELSRYESSAAVDLLFDQIVASVRLVGTDQ